MHKASRGQIRLSLAFLLSLIVSVVGLPLAHGANFSVTYDANSNYVGAYSQAGITTGALPATASIAQGATVNVAAQGNLARQGFTFGGWNTAANGSGTTYAAGASSFVLGAANVTLYAKWEVPVAARLIGNGGTIIQVLNSNSVTDGGKCISAGIRGITSDGTHIYFRPSTNLGYICKVTSTGVVVSVHQVVGLENVAEQSIAIVYGNGCLFLRKDASATFNSIYCIALSNWSLNSVALNGSTLPAGSFWLFANFIQFPDGRIGSVGTSVASNVWAGGEGTGAGKCPAGMYCKTLRLFTVSGTGTSVTTSYSTDFILADSASSWPSDDHGIATDGTYLYQIRHASGYKVWALRSDGPSYLVFNGDESGSCGAATGQTGTQCTITYPINGLSSGGALVNSTYFGRAHGLNKYLVGDYDITSKFWLSSAAIPPDGPGNPDVTPPSFTNSDTFTVSENIATSFNAATITVNDSATIAIAAGNDGALFNIVIAETATAYLRFKNSPDYEGPTDVGTNNVYNITVSATDSVGNARSRTFAIVITNLNEPSTTTPPSISGFAYKGVVISLTVTVNSPGTVRFFLSGKRIAGCLSRPTSGNYPNYTATCQWKPPVMGFQNLTAELTPSDPSFSRSTSAIGTFWVYKRTTLR